MITLKDFQYNWISESYRSKEYSIQPNPVIYKSENPVLRRKSWAVCRVAGEFLHQHKVIANVNSLEQAIQVINAH